MTVIGMRYLRSNQSVNPRGKHILVSRLTRKSVCILRAAILSKMALRWRYGAELLNKVIIFVLFLYKKYSRCFITLWLNHWWQVDYSDNVSLTFLCLDSESYLAVNGTVTSLLVFIQNILNWVPKMSKAFMGLERHGGKWLLTKFSFWGGVSI